MKIKGRRHDFGKVSLVFLMHSVHMLISKKMKVVVLTLHLLN